MIFRLREEILSLETGGVEIIQMKNFGNYC
jgi:hypothetical protein